MKEKNNNEIEVIITADPEKGPVCPFCGDYYEDEDLTENVVECELDNKKYYTCSACAIPQNRYIIWEEKDPKDLFKVVK